MRSYRFVLFAGFSIFVLMPCVLQLHAQITEMLLQSFTGTGGLTPGASPESTLIFDSSGNLYGTTTQGGTYNAGLLFKLDASLGYAETVLHTFTGNAAGDGDGGFPTAGVVMDASGNLYGTTSCGGDGACSSSGLGGDGIIYKINITTGTYTVLYRFGGGRDGSRPYAPLIRAGNYLYGTSTHGGLGSCSDGVGVGCGTLFKIATSTGLETVLYRFTGGIDGGIPYAPVVHDKLGRFDGTTSIGGLNGMGTIFAFISNTESVLHDFTGGADGGLPYSGLTVDSTNSLYGTATCGGTPGVVCPAGNGVVFELSPSAGFQTLHAFSGAPDGALPLGGVILDYLGNLCGATDLGGGVTPPMGTLFTLTKSSGYLTELLYDFGSAGTGDGANPVAGLTFGPKAKKKQLCPGVASLAPLPPKKGTCTYVCGVVGTLKSGGASGQGAVFEAR